ncbi:hypothetical protein ACQUQU_14970 [Thalassolituus sp. LLYu03]|uniref:hypothetical protein n=1 Tax=Thalassolituus sp. LLYu03 TaxID=3421656 RepID=UPI003D2DA282
MAKHLFLASTPFNVLTAAMVALELPAGDQAELGLIDQTNATSAFRAALSLWSGAPFARIHELSSKVNGRNKRQQRRASFARILHELSRFSPDWIYTGNDRRVEFQFAMAHSKARGVYLDDGTYSYIGRKTHWLTDQVLDNLVKKLAYGWWWKQPPAIGASAWIDHSVLAFPQSAISALRQKPCRPLPANLSRPEFAELAELCLGSSADALRSLNALVLLPHSSVQSARAHDLGRWLTKEQAPRGYKHHPRTENQYRTAEAMSALWSIDGKAEEVPSSAPMEILLPLLSQDCKIAGDVSTALLTAKWLRPELSVTALVSDTTDASWRHLLSLTGVALNNPA